MLSEMCGSEPRMNWWTYISRQFGLVIWKLQFYDDFVAHFWCAGLILGGSSRIKYFNHNTPFGLISKTTSMYEKVGSRTFRRFPESGPLLVFLPIKIFLQMLILVILPSKTQQEEKREKRAKRIVGREGSQSLETCQGGERGDPRSAGGLEVAVRS